MHVSRAKRFRLRVGLYRVATGNAYAVGLYLSLYLVQFTLLPSAYFTVV